ncbi:MAG: VWA domain-containing protein [Gammaproteobacteria bacterium]
MFSFEYPLWFLAIPAMLVLYFMVIRRNKSNKIKQPAIIHSQASVLIELNQMLTSEKKNNLIWLLGMGLLIIAMTRPQWLDLSSEKMKQGQNIMLVIDISGSMRAQESSLNQQLQSRLDIVKQSAHDFILQRNNDRIGTIVFATDAATYLPLSTDKELVAQFVSEIQHGIAGEKTALGDAIALATRRLQETPKKGRTLILFTDGANTAGSVTPDSALILAKQNAVRIYTIGVGTDRTIAFPRGPVEKPQFTELPLDESLLRKLANETGGKYYTAGSDSELQRILDDIDQLETVDIVDPGLAEKTDCYWLPLLIGLLLIMLSELNVRSRVLPC